MITSDFLVVGGGIAGSSAAASLASHGHTVMIEAEPAFGYHSSGRSATYYHYGIGNPTVHGLTAFSLGHFAAASINGIARSKLSPALFIATSDMIGELEALEQRMGLFSDGLERMQEEDIRAQVPVLRCGGQDVVAGVVDHAARRLDSEVLLQEYRALLRRAGGDAISGARAASIRRVGGTWEVTTQKGERFAAPVLINAAGAWCDEVARMAGVPPLRLRPLRRTMISIDLPDGTDARPWPFTKTAVDDFYMLPESGRLLACPVDEIPSAPADAQPEEYDVALAASKLEQYTTLTVRRIAARWAGLRTFTADRVPVAGFDPAADGFFWLAGQGGYGLQTAPAMAAITEALVTGSAWPERLAQLGVTKAAMGVERLPSSESAAPPNL